MEIKRYEYKLKYGVLDFLLDMLPPCLAAALNIRIVGFGFKLIRRSDSSAGRFCISMMISAAVVFSLVFLYEIIEQIVTGSSRKVRIESLPDCFLIRFGCRCRFFRKADVAAFDFDNDRKRLTFILRRCLEKRRGIFSYIRLFTGKNLQNSAFQVSDYLEPLVTGGLDSLKFGLPDPAEGPSFNPFAWMPVTHLQMIERDGTFQFSIPCESGTVAAGVISRIIGGDVSRFFRDL